MSIQERIVCDKNGQKEDNILGTIQAENLYTFYAVTTDGTDKKDITLVLPVGGELSGLYRFPRVGEKVLVEVGGTSGSGNYLLGYIPSEQNDPFAPVDEKEKKKLLKDGKGMVFRYQQTGKKPEKVEAGEQYSEIGFYHEPTQWEPKSGKVDDYAEKATKNYPKIDRINIQSAGDIKSKAQNFHQTRAKRFELLVNCDEVDHSTESYPYGDRAGDDSSLYAGDAHIRAKNRVIVKAGDEIVLEVGRSSIVINDEGIYLASRKTQSNITNGWDTIISLKAQDGLAMFGQHVSIAAGIDFKITEGYGGKIFSRLGILKINGYDICMETINAYNYISMGVANGLDWLTNAVTMICGAANVDTSGTFKDIGSKVSAKSVRSVAPFIGSLGTSQYAMGGKTNYLGTLVNLLNTLMKVTMVVGIILDKTIPKEKKFNHGRDGLYTALSLVEYGLVVAAFATSGAFGVVRPIWESSIHQRTSGDIEVEGFTFNTSSVANKAASAPLAAMGEAGIKEAYKDGVNKYINKFNSIVDKLGTIGFLAAGIGVAVVAGVGGGVGSAAYIHASNADAELQEELSRL